MPALSFLDKQHAVAPPGYNRWLVPPAALAIHLSIGEVYAFSVFKIPLTQAIGISEHNAGLDWSQPQVAWIFSIAIAFLGISTAVFGGWLERVGPRKVMFAAACCFGGGFLVGAAGVHWHQIWLLYLGYGVIGGIGLGLGYISPVATLVRWFPDRPGLATGLAIMGFGGGALIGGPLERFLMTYFRSPTSVGVTGAMIVMGIAYFGFMMVGVFTIRTTPPGWRPAGWEPKPQQASGGMITTRNIEWRAALRTPQFYLLWLVLCLNTTAGIGIIEQASPMIQDMFAGKWATPALAGAAGTGFVGLLSLFNMGGRFFWSAISDYIGRKWTYMCFFVLGVVFYALVPQSGVQRWNSIALFVLFCGVLISMYGGGFSTMPAFVRDLFGARDLSQIYGRILTAWSVAGIAGPTLVNYIREYQLNHGVAQTHAYSTVLYVMSGLLFLGLVCNALIRPVSERAYATEAAPSSQPATDASEPQAGKTTFTTPNP